MLIIGITGSLGTGKTTVARIFKGLGAVVLDADEIAHRLIEPGKIAWKRIRKYFGDTILDNNGAIKRGALAQEAFSDRPRLNKLCGIIHPLVYKEIEQEIKKIKKADRGAIVVLDVPLLLESGGRSRVDKLIVVTVRAGTQMNRELKKFRLTRSDISRRIKAQMPLGEKVKAADFVINNNGSLKETKRQAISIWKRLMKEQAVLTE